MSDLATRLRTACDQVRVKSYPLSDLIPLMQQAADAIAAAPAQPRTNDIARAIVEAADMNDRVLAAIDAEFAAPAQQPWKYTPPAQERIDALELEVRQLTEQIAGLRGGGVAKEYAELPESCYEDDAGLKTYDSGDMRTFADETHALRIQQPAPSAAPEGWKLVPTDAQIWAAREAWGKQSNEHAAIREALVAGWAVSAPQPSPTPQADSQPAPEANLIDGYAEGRPLD